MSRTRSRRRLPRRLAAVSAACAAVALAACGEKDEPDLSTVTDPAGTTSVPTPTVPPATPQGGTGTGTTP